MFRNTSGALLDSKFVYGSVGGSDVRVIAYADGYKVDVGCSTRTRKPTENMSQSSIALPSIQSPSLHPDPE